MGLVETGTEPKIRLVKKLDDGETHRDLSPLKFLAELQQHLPKTWEQTTRYFGKYASRTRGVERLEREWKQQSHPDSTVTFFDADGSATVIDDKTKASPSWARMIKQIYEVDPLQCEKCGGRMKIVAFIHNNKEIQKICDNLGLQPYRAPPPLTKTAPVKSTVQIPLLDDWHTENTD